MLSFSETAEFPFLPHSEDLDGNEQPDQTVTVRHLMILCCLENGSIYVNGTGFSAYTFSSVVEALVH